MLIESQRDLMLSRPEFRLTKV